MRNPLPRKELDRKKRDKFKETMGMPISNAHRKLHKDLIYFLAKKCDMLNCFVCSKHIDREELSIEHKNPWTYGDLDSFCNPENIAFSHIKCNKPHKIINGSVNIHYHNSNDNFCNTCKIIKPKEDFVKSKKYASGVTGECKKCKAKRNKLRIRSNNADLAQLVERNVSTVDVAGSTPVIRSNAS